MRLSNSPLLQPEILSAVPADKTFNQAQWKTDEEVILRKVDDIILMRQGDSVVALNPGPQSGALEFHAENTDALWLLVRSKSKQVGLKCLVPVRSTILGRGLEFGVDQRTADSLHQQRQIVSPTVRMAIAWLTDEFVLFDADHGKQRVFAAIHARQDACKLQLQGRRFIVDLGRQTDAPLWVDRITARRKSQIDAISLLEGDIRFVDAAVAVNDEGGIEQTLLNAAVTSYGAYLDLWRLYSEKEWQKDVARAANIGTLRFSACKPISEEDGGWSLTVDPHARADFASRWRKFSSEDDELEVDELAPDWQGDRYTDLNTRDAQRRFRGKLDLRRDGVALESTDSTRPPDSGYAYLSVTGNRKQQERRNDARRIIEAGLGVPNLSRLLQDLPLPKQRASTLAGLTPYAAQSFSNGKATSKQELAIKIALNTPDVALIIGPPGTGKTQVIAALGRRLAELNEGRTISQQVLISSFQHDAVENALERTDVYGLPPIKVGRSRRQENVDAVAVWSKAHTLKLDERIQQMREAEPTPALLDQLDRLLNHLLIVGVPPEGRDQALTSIEDLLQKLAGSARIRPSVTWQSNWAEYRDRSAASTGQAQGLSQLKRRRLTRAARSLRVLPASFADDGRQRALYVLSLVTGVPGIAGEREDWILRTMAMTESPDGAQLLELAVVRDHLLDALRPDQRPVKIRNALDDEAAGLLYGLQTEIADKVAASRSGCHGVLERYRDAFVSYPAWVFRSIENYSSIVGATCQQSASHLMTRLKNIAPEAAYGIQFQSVIIDEAARANPLDLFIPMSMAKRRIILVGDHRQLPHLLDSDIEDEIRSERGDQVDSKTYKDSLFERLWLQFKAREAADGVPRVAMLDMQFRMHPILGDFMSQQFYESAGLEKVRSGRSADDFVETVPMYGKGVCRWLDVPFDAGADERVDKSRMRSAEAIRIASEVKRLLGELSPTMSIGVITFYAAQRDRIFKAMEQYGISEQGEEGWRVRPEHASSQDCKERLRIGTVDAFQGKEFDVVFLSTVRSNSMKLVPLLEMQSEEDFEKSASQKYGHLRSSNRLNVAMSRQKRLLIAVGDKSMFTGLVANDAVPEMSAFVDLCDAEVQRVG